MRAALGGLHIARPRIEEAMAQARVVLLEAPSGYGKSTAWAALSTSLDMATIRVVLRSPRTVAGLLSSIAAGARRAGLPLLADAIQPDDPDSSLGNIIDRLAATDPILIGIDEVQRADADATAWLTDLALELGAPNRMAIAGRRLSARLRALPERTNAVLIGANDLLFDRDETRALILAAHGAGAGRETPSEHEVDALRLATGGWPAALVLAVQSDAAESAVSMTGSAPGAEILRRLIDRLFESADSTLLAQLAAVSSLPLLSAESAAAVAGDGALDRLLDAGIPITFRADGWAELPDPVREAMRPAPLTRAQGREVAEHYAVRGELAEAAELLMRSRDHDGVARLLASQPRDALTRAGLAIFEALVSELPDAVLREHPGALVQLVRAADAQPWLHERWLSRADSVVEPDTPFGRAIAAERARALARAGDLDGARALAVTVIESAPADELTTIGRAHLSRALCMVVQDTTAATSQVRESFETAASRFHLTKERDWEAEALQGLGYGVWYTSGALGAAADALERALSLRPAPNAARAETLVLLAEVLIHMDRLDDAAVAVREARTIAQRLGDERSLGYAAWTSADLGGALRDREMALAALEEAERHPGGWFEGLAGIDFLSDASEIRAVVGDVDGAWRDLRRAEARAAGTAREGEPLSARVRLEAMYGDAETGLRLVDALEASPFEYPNDRWVHALLRAACLARLGRAEDARVQVRRARQVAAQLGDSERPARHEPELLAIAEPGAPVAEATTTVVTLGRFAVERGARDVSPPPGRPATLVKLLGVRAQVTVDEAIEELWPEIDEETGRARLRNLLNRIRAACGELVLRSDGALALAPGVQVDAARFEEEASAALKARSSTRAGLARAALARSTGELLPADRYAEWAAVPRERLRRRQLALIDLVSEDALKRGDFDEAERLLDAAISLDPLDELRYVRLAQALLTQGRLRGAKRVAEQAAAVASDLGAVPTDELSTLLGELEISLPSEAA